MIKTMRKWLFYGWLLLGLWSLKSVVVHAAMKPAYDMSQWQKQFTASQVAALKKEVSFVILRVQDGTQYQDQTFQTNVKLIRQFHIPYGVYSYSRYTSVNDAKQEARQLYHSDPQALFYVNDIEENNAGAQLNLATGAWAQQMKTLTKKPVVIYSGLSFMNTQIGDARGKYTAIWLASYSSYEPNPTYQYDLWQYTDRQYSTALGQNVDASIIPTGGKSLSFWTHAKHNPMHVVTHQYQHVAGSKTTKSIRPKARRGYNPHYYSDPHIKQLKVTSKDGVSVYNRYHQRVLQCVQNDVIAVASFRRLGHITQAVTPNGNYFTANKKLVEQVK